MCHIGVHVTSPYVDDIYLIRMNPINRTRNHPRKPLDSAKLGASGSFVKAGDVGILETASLRYLYTP